MKVSVLITYPMVSGNIIMIKLEGYGMKATSNKESSMVSVSFMTLKVILKKFNKFYMLESGKMASSMVSEPISTMKTTSLKANGKETAKLKDMLPISIRKNTSKSFLVNKASKMKIISGKNPGKMNKLKKLRVRT